MVTKQEFITKIKTKYPDYKSVDDNVLFDKIIAKYPQYKDQIEGDNAKLNIIQKGAKALFPQEYINIFERDKFYKEPFERGKVSPERKQEVLNAIKEMQKAQNLRTNIALTGAAIAGGFTPLSPVFLGGIEALRAGVVEKKPFLQALKRGATAATIDLALRGAGKAAGWAAGKTGSAIFRGKTPEKVMARAIENPALIDNADDLVGAGQKITEQAGRLARGQKESYKVALNAINIEKEVSTKTASEAIKRYGLSEDIFASMLKRARTANVSNVTDDVIDKFVKGKNISFNDAKQISGFIDDIAGGQVIEEIGGGAPALVKGVGWSLKRQMAVAAPEIKGMNKGYRETARIYKNIIKEVTKKAPDGKTILINENAVEKLGLQSLGVNVKKGQQLKWLQELSEKTGSDIVGTTKDSAARSMINKGGPSLFSRFLGAGTGGAAGTVLGPFGTGGGILAGAGISQMLGQPDVLKAAVKIGPNIPKFLAGITTPARTLLSQDMAKRLQ